MERRSVNDRNASRRLLGPEAGRTYTFGENEIDFPCAHVNSADTRPLLLHSDPRPRRNGRLAPPRIRARSASSDATPISQEAIAEQRRLGLVCAEQISLAVANAKLRDQLRDQSIRDALTGMYNRRYMLETCRREFSRASTIRTMRRHPLDRCRSLQEVQRQSWSRRRRHRSARDQRLPEGELPRRGCPLPLRR